MPVDEDVDRYEHVFKDHGGRGGLPAELLPGFIVSQQPMSVELALA